MQFTVNQRLRPLKFAFLVPPENPRSVRRAIRLSTFQWGGLYNPIIPVYRRMPATWADRHLRIGPVKKVIQGYLETFDPDVVVNCGVPKAHLPDVRFRQLIQEE